MKRGFLVISLLFSTLFPSYGQSLQSDALFAEGVRLYELKEYQKAIPFFSKADSLDKIELVDMPFRMGYPSMWLASCYYKMGDLQSAGQYQYPGFRSAPVDRRKTIESDILSQLCSEDMEQGRYSEALEKLRKIDILEKAACGSDNYFHRGTYLMFSNCFRMMNQLDSSLFYLKKTETIERRYFEKNDTLLINTLGLQYDVLLQKTALSEAREKLGEIRHIVHLRLPSSHPICANIAFQTLYLDLCDKKYKTASSSLPAYIQQLKTSYGNDPSMFKYKLSEVRNLFISAARMDDVVYLDNLAIEQDMPEDFSRKVIIAISNWTNKPTVEQKRRALQEGKALLSAYPKESYPVLNALMESCEILQLGLEERTEEAKDMYLALKATNPEEILQGTEFYPVYLAMDMSMSAVIADYEGVVKAADKVLEITPPDILTESVSTLGNIAAFYVVAGEYGKARELTELNIADFEKKRLLPGTPISMVTDTAAVSGIIRMFDAKMETISFYIDSTRYELQDLQSQYEWLKVRLLARDKDYLLNEDYKVAYGAYLSSLRLMRRYDDAKDACQDFLRALAGELRTVDLKSKKKSVLAKRERLDELIGWGLFQHFTCYDDDDPGRIQARSEYLDWAKAIYGPYSEEYVNSLLTILQETNDYNGYISEIVPLDEGGNWTFSPFVYSQIATSYKRLGQKDKWLKYEKKAVLELISQEENQDGFHLYHSLNDINKYYSEQRDMQGWREFYKGELWPATEGRNDLLMISIYACDGFENDDFLADAVQEGTRRKIPASSPALQACFHEALAAATRHSNPETAISHCKEAYTCQDDNPLLKLIIGCHLHMLLSGHESYREEAIALGEELMASMRATVGNYHSAEGSQLLNKQIRLQSESGNWEAVKTLSQTLFNTMSGIDQHQMLYSLLLTESSSQTSEFAYLQRSPFSINLFSWELDDIRKYYYQAQVSLNPEDAGKYAISLIRDDIRRTESFIQSNMLEDSHIRSMMSQATSLAYMNPGVDSLKQYAYETAMMGKGLRIRSDFALRELIRKSGHRSALRKYDELFHTERLLEMASSQQTDSLVKRRNVLRSDLLRLSEFFGDFKSHLLLSFKNVQNALEPDALAIEFTQISKEDYGITAPEGYYASVLRRDMAIPELVYLFPSESIDLSEDVYSDEHFSRLLLTPLSPFLKGVKRIYFSAIGALNMIALESLPVPGKASITLAQQYEMFRLSSTREIAEAIHPDGIGAVVYGGLAYDTSVESLVKNAATFPEVRERNITLEEGQDDEDPSGRGVLRGIPFLPGTLTEAKLVGETLSQSKDSVLQATLLVGPDGTETSFKALSGKHKKVLHIATHGFYFSQKESVKSKYIETDRRLHREDQSMRRSGLFFAGAESRYRGQVIPKGVDDGILTAQEIANTNLTGMDLVVLSACETGSGDVGSEGVYGLQRGFKKAGVGSIIMSLWKVDDDATQHLMSEFYRNWVSGMGKREALDRAKEAVRAIPKWAEPHYWAGFILLDGVDSH